MRGPVARLTLQIHGPVPAIGNERQPLPLSVLPRILRLTFCGVIFRELINLR